jgi:hypothetical protein
MFAQILWPTMTKTTTSRPLTHPTASAKLINLFLQGTTIKSTLEVIQPPVKVVDHDKDGDLVLSHLIDNSEEYEVNRNLDIGECDNFLNLCSDSFNFMFGMGRSYSRK